MAVQLVPVQDILTNSYLFTFLKRQRLKKAFNQIDSTSDNFFLFQHKTKLNVFAITIVAPEHRLDFIHKPKSDYCYLSSELLLKDSSIPNANKHYPTRYEQRVFMFMGDKIAFANNVELNNSSIDFDGFIPTFDLINRIILTPNSTFTMP